MGDKIIITEDEDKSEKPEVVVVAPQPAPQRETVVTEKTTVTKIEES